MTCKPVTGVDTNVTGVKLLVLFLATHMTSFWFIPEVVLESSSEASNSTPWK